MADNIREIITSAVRDALTSRPSTVVQLQSSQPDESEQNRGKKRKADNKYFTSSRQISFGGLPRSLYGEELLLQPVDNAWAIMG